MGKLTVAVVAFLGTLYFGAPVHGSDVVTPAEQSASAVDTMAVNGVQPDSVVANKAAAPALLSLTLDELAQYNGLDGKPAYVAISGVVYDVTNVKAWRKRKHHGHTPGADRTEEIKKSPHKLKVLKKLTIVGNIVEK